MDISATAISLVSIALVALAIGILALQSQVSELRGIIRDRRCRCQGTETGATRASRE